MAVETVVTAPMVNDGELPITVKPVGVDDGPVEYRLHRGARGGFKQEPKIGEPRTIGKFSYRSIAHFNGCDERPGQ